MVSGAMKLGSIYNNKFLAFVWWFRALCVLKDDFDVDSDEEEEDSLTNPMTQQILQLQQMQEQKQQQQQQQVQPVRTGPSDTSPAPQQIKTQTPTERPRDTGSQRPPQSGKYIIINICSTFHHKKTIRLPVDQSSLSFKQHGLTSWVIIQSEVSLNRHISDIHYSKKLKEHDQHHLWYVDTLRSSC